MNKLSLQNAFKSYFHNKYAFEDFCILDTREHYKEIFYSKNTFSPSSKLKDFQKFLNLFIFEKLSINKNIIFSYRKGLNVKDAILPHSNNKYILTTDIKSFFASINIDKLRQIILQDKELFLIVQEDIEKYIESILNITIYNGILPVGSPSSPLISNAYLFDLDNELEEYCSKSNIAYTRYSDDFIFSSNSKEYLNNIVKLIDKLFNNFDLKRNDKKTKIQKQGSNKIVILGIVLTQQGFITVDSNYKKNIEILLHFYLTDKEKFNDYFSKKFSSNIDKVSGLLSYINSVDTFYISKLKRKYGSYLVNSFIHRDINVSF